MLAYKMCYDKQSQTGHRGETQRARGARGGDLRRAPPNTLSDLRAAPLAERVKLQRPQISNKMSDAVNVVFPRKLVKEFITLYQNLPCLWDKHCISYKMKHKRHEAITKLTELVQEYDPSATRVHVLRKIESLRACVRREHKRVQHSKKIAENEADVYTPHLWYYDLFSFMFRTDEMNEVYDKTKRESTSPQPGAAADSVEESDPDEETQDEDDASFEAAIDDNYSSAGFTIASNLVEVPESTSGDRAPTKKFLDEDNKNKKHFTEVDDEYDAIGVNVAAKLRNLPGNMRILAEKLLNDVLYLAQMHALTNTTTVTTPNCSTFQ